MQLKTLGAFDTVTGSKHLVTHENFNLLIDCGLYQGEDEKLNKLKLELPNIDAIILTHSHLDHCGYIPKLVADGFKGKVYCTELTKQTSRIVLEDSAKLQEQSRKDGKSPLYFPYHVTTGMKQFVSKEVGENFSLGPFNITFFCAGHIPGAVSVAIECEGRKWLFSGDIGRDEEYLVEAPKVSGEYEKVILESTYGDKEHPDKEADERTFIDAIKYVIENKGTLILPAFSVARSQSLIFYLYYFFKKHKKLKLPIYFDSPMAIEVNRIYEENISKLKCSKDEWDKVFDEVSVCDEAWKQKALTQNSEVKIIISSSGMLSGGRVLTHLEKYIQLQSTSIVISGYQSVETLGAKLINNHKRVTFNKKEHTVKAQVYVLHSFSAHADRVELKAYLESIEFQELLLNHGEQSTQQALLEYLQATKY
jgi:metallo-beta-lactamase family protein